jgi:hypothetical protein
MRIVVIDRFEGDLAVLVPDDSAEVLHGPCAHLPAGVREGDCLRMEENGATTAYEAANRRRMPPRPLVPQTE